ncbi:MAG: prepilin peptidase [Planctomycetota bacterium]
MDLSRELFVVWWSAVGLVVGSFLNVAIHRLPRAGESIAHPRRSRCPRCRHALTWRENIPVFSFVLLRGRCRWCGGKISWRYPLVEVLTAVLWGYTAFRAVAGAGVGVEAGIGAEHWGLVLVQNAVLAGLVVATFVDFACFEIPDEVSIGGIVLAPIASLAVPALHGSTWIAGELSAGEGVDRLGALLGSLAGLAVGGGALLAVGGLGKRVYGRDAMGLGDVKLLAAGGGFVGPGGALVALLLASFVASAVGVIHILRFYALSRARAHRRGSRKSRGRSLRVARAAGRYIPFGPYLGIGIGIVLLAWNDVARFLTDDVF